MASNKLIQSKIEKVQQGVGQQSRSLVHVKHPNLNQTGL